MKRIKAFFYVYRNSLFNVKYYRDLINVNLDFSFKYFLILGTLATIITAVGITGPKIPQVRSAIGGALESLKQAYPSELVISAKDGKWEINQPEPYAIPTPKFFSPEMFAEEYRAQVEEDFNNDFPTNLVVFDHNGTINDLENKNTFIVVNDVNLIALNSQNNIEVRPIESLPDGEFNVDDYTGLINTLEGYTRYVPAVMIFFVTLGLLFYYLILRALYLLIVALILLTVGNLRGMRYGFKTYYKLGLHTLTLPLTIETLFAILAISVPIPFWFFGINLVFGITVVYFLSNMELPSNSGVVGSGESTKRTEKPAPPTIEAVNSTETSKK